MDIEIELIKIDERKRPVSMQRAAELAHSISEIGLLNPVTVRQNNGFYHLVAGAHRLEACKILQWKTIPASLFEGDDLDAELAEIDENLRRNELTI